MEGRTQRLRYATYVAVFSKTTVMSSLNEKSTDQLGNRVAVRVRGALLPWRN